MGSSTYNLGNTSENESSLLSTAEKSEDLLNGFAKKYESIKVPLAEFDNISSSASLAKDIAASAARGLVVPGGTRKVTPDNDGLFGMSNNKISGIADLGNLAVSAFAAYDGYKTAKLNRKALQFNLDTAKAEQSRRKSNISGFNSFGSSAPAQTAMA